METITRKQAALKGSQFYYTGKKCKRGHVTERYVFSGDCVDCASTRRKKHRRDFKKLIKAGRKNAAVGVSVAAAE